MSLARSVTAVVTVALVALQLLVGSNVRLLGVVAMLIWLWPVAIGLTGLTSLAVAAGAVAGFLWDAYASTPLGLGAAVGALLGYGASRLGREGVGDLDSAAWWMTPLLGAVAGLVAPLLFVVLGSVMLDFALWHGSVVDAMIVNAAVFALLARPVTRLARWTCASALRGRR